MAIQDFTTGKELTVGEAQARLVELQSYLPTVDAVNNAEHYRVVKAAIDHITAKLAESGTGNGNGAGTTTTTTQGGLSDIFSMKITLPIVGEVPVVLLGVAALILFGGDGKKRR